MNASSAGAPAAGAGGAAADGGGAAGGAGMLAPPAERGPLFPAKGAKDVCVDPQLRIHYDAKPALGSSGKIQVFRQDQPSAAVAVVDLAQANIDVTLGGTMFHLPRPVYVDGNDVLVRLPPRALAYGQSYYVTVDDGAISAPGGAAPSFHSATDWPFTTRAAAPSDLTDLRVALDGSGAFCSVQGALDAVPARPSAPARITIGSGTYFEVIHSSGKHDLTLHGEDRKQTIILGVNNNSLNGSTATRSLLGIDSSTGLIIENLTIHNLTPQGGSQAEALRLQNCDQCVVRDADILSLQDTLLWSGRIYAHNCFIAGNVDYIWGTGAAFFDHCEIKTVGRAGYLVQARNAANASGYVFVDSKLSSDPGVTNDMLGRIDVSAYPGSQVAYIDCQMGPHVSPVGWTVTGGAASGSLRFWEYQSTDLNGAPLDVSRRLAGSKQISAAQADMLRDPKQVLGGWQPPP